MLATDFIYGRTKIEPTILEITTLEDNHSVVFPNAYFNKAKTVFSTSPKYIVNWGDGNIEVIEPITFKNSVSFIVSAITDFIKTHTYINKGNYTVKIYCTEYTDIDISFNPSVYVKLWNPMAIEGGISTVKKELPSVSSYFFTKNKDTYIYPNTFGWNDIVTDIVQIGDNFGGIKFNGFKKVTRLDPVYKGKTDRLEFKGYDSLIYIQPAIFENSLDGDLFQWCPLITNDTLPDNVYDPIGHNFKTLNFMFGGMKGITIAKSVWTKSFINVQTTPHLFGGTASYKYFWKSIDCNIITVEKGFFDPMPLTSIFRTFYDTKTVKKLPEDCFKNKKTLINADWAFYNHGIELIPKGFLVGCENLEKLTYFCTNAVYATKDITIDGLIFEGCKKVKTAIGFIREGNKSKANIPNGLTQDFIVCTNFAYALADNQRIEGITKDVIPVANRANITSINGLFRNSNIEGFVSKEYFTGFNPKANIGSLFAYHRAIGSKDVVFENGLLDPFYEVENIDQIFIYSGFSDLPRTTEGKYFMSNMPKLKHASRAFSGMGNITLDLDSIFDNNPDLENVSHIFSLVRFKNLKSSLFANNLRLKNLSFLFQETGLDNVQSGLLSNLNDLENIEGAFSKTQIESLDSSVFKSSSYSNNVNIDYLLFSSTKLKFLAADTFKSFVNSTSFDGVIEGCLGLTELHEDIFKGLTNLVTFKGLFRRNLVNVTKDYFKYHKAANVEVDLSFMCYTVWWQQKKYAGVLENIDGSIFTGLKISNVKNFMTNNAKYSGELPRFWSTHPTATFDKTTFSGCKNASNYQEAVDNGYA